MFLIRETFGMGLQSGGKFYGSDSINFNMAEPMCVKLSGLVKYVVQRSRLTSPKNFVKKLNDKKVTVLPALYIL